MTYSKTLITETDSKSIKSNHTEIFYLINKFMFFLSRKMQKGNFYLKKSTSI